MPTISKDTTKLAVTGLGVGLASTIAGYLSPYASTIPATWIELLVGLGVWKYGHKLHRLVPDFGAGVMLAGIGGLVEQYIVPVIPQTGQVAQMSTQSVGAPAPMMTTDQMLASLAHQAAQGRTQTYGPVEVMGRLGIQ